MNDLDVNSKVRRESDKKRRVGARVISGLRSGVETTLVRAEGAEGEFELEKIHLET